MIELKNISKTYKSGQLGVHALDNLSLKICPGEFVAIMGPSGSGKSTLLHILGFLDRPDSGSYTLGGKEITVFDDDHLAVLRSRIAGFVFQQFHLLPRVSALENAELPLMYAGKRKLRQIARDKLSEVGLASRLSHHPNELSGGEQQRVAIARSLVNEPLIIFADEPTGNLDTKSEEEIIKILEGLNKNGKTIIMVTHEKEIAEHAKRIIFMRDGKIVSDEVKGVYKTGKSATSECVSLGADLVGREMSGYSTEFFDHCRQAFFSIFSHKMRAFLSILGILIGVAAVIAMLALGQGAREALAKNLASLGSNLLTVRPGSRRLHGVALESGAVTRFTPLDAEAIAKLPQVKRISPSVTGRGQVVYGNKNWNTQLQGTSEEYPFMRAAEPDAGRFFTREELMMRQKVVLLGRTVIRELFGDSNPIGSIIKINRINFTVIGILPEKGATGWRDQDDVAIIPITTAMYRVLGKEYLDSIDVEVKDASLMAEAEKAIKAFVIKGHRLSKDNEDSFEIRNMAEIQDVMESTNKTMTMLLGSIAAISLLVGGIGIMNIMLVSVTERTREIGLRKAIGARKGDIISQFLIESVFMTFLGGIIGIILGAGIAWALASFAGWPAKVSMFSTILALTFSISIGIGFGLWPAFKASAFNPIEALRYE